MADWHPILCAHEGPAGTWRMIDAQGRTYGSIEIRRVMDGAEVRYKAVYRDVVIGWATSLRVACERVHAAYVKDHGPGGGPIADWGGRRAV